VLLIRTDSDCQVTDIRGKPLDFSQGRTLMLNTGVIATTGAIHDQVIAVCIISFVFV
jgi:hypothetical protein